MWKIIGLFMAMASLAFGADTLDSAGEMMVMENMGVDSEMLKSFSVLAAGVGLGLAALGGAIGMGNTAAATIAGIARNPGLSTKLTTTMFIALALIEAQVIYALVVSMIVLYANPFL